MTDIDHRLRLERALGLVQADLKQREAELAAAVGRVDELRQAKAVLQRLIDRYAVEAVAPGAGEQR